MTVLTHKSSNTTIPSSGNPATADIANNSVVDLGTFTPDAAGNPTAVPDVTYLTQEVDTDIVHVSRDRFNLVEKNADVYFGRLPAGDSWALVWSEIREFNVSGLVLPITEIFIIASYDGGARHDTKSYVRLDGLGNAMPAFYSLPTTAELCGMIADKSGASPGLGDLDYIDVRFFFGECNSGCATANPATCNPLGASPVGSEALMRIGTPGVAGCGTCRGRPMYISYFVPKSVPVTSPLLCADTPALAARSEIRNIQNTYGGLCQWIQEMITAKYYVPASWGIQFQASLADLTTAINHIT